MSARFSMTARRGLSGIAVLVLVTACTATPASSGPAATDDFTEPTFTVEPEATDEPLLSYEAPPENDLGNQLPATVTVSISGNTSGANGSYTASGLTRICGNLQLNFTGNPNGFNLEVWYDGEHNPNDVSFAAENLLPGTTTSAFNVDIGITTNQITPSIIANPGGTVGDAGTATRTESGGITTLVIHATNNRSETIDLTATCGPRP